VDRIEGREPRIDRDDLGVPEAVWLSARDNRGVDLLIEAIAERLGPDRFDAWLHLTPELARLRARFYDAGAVITEESDEHGEISLHVRMPHTELEQLLRREDVTLSDLTRS
jgi:GTP-binding protein HflX